MLRSPERPMIDLSKRDRLSNSVMTNKGNVSLREHSPQRGLLPEMPSKNMKSHANLRAYDSIDEKISKKLFGSITV